MEDILYRFLSIYNSLPVFLKELFGRIYNSFPKSLKYGSFYEDYQKRVKFFREIQTLKDIEKEQTRILLNQVNAAIKSTPFYSGISNCITIEEFNALPVINKDIITADISSFLNEKLIHKGLKTNTGGSSGNPMELYLEKHKSRPKEKSHFDWYWAQFGYKSNDKMLMIRGLPLHNNRLFEYITINSILNVSCYNVNETNIFTIIDEINHFGPKFIHGYPSSLKILTNLLEPHRELLEMDIQCIFLGSEHLNEMERNYFERFYKSRVISWYGHTERLIHGGNCLYTNDFHFYQEYGYMELLDNNNKPIIKAGIEGKIVATGYDNSVMPLIRYDTGDIGILSEHTECQCGFKGKSLSKIVGREQDIIVLSDLTKVSLTAFIFGQHWESFKRIKEFQVIQRKFGEIELNIVRSQDYTQKDEEAIINTLTKSVNNKIRISIHYITHVPKTHRGKNIFFESKIALSDLNSSNVK